MFGRNVLPPSSGLKTEQINEHEASGTDFLLGLSFYPEDGEYVRLKRPMTFTQSQYVMAQKIQLHNYCCENVRLYIT
jgi:hypothetical protein